MQGTLDQGTPLAKQAPKAETPSLIILSSQAGIDPGPVAGLLERAGLKRPAAPDFRSPSQPGPIALHECKGLENGSRQLLDQPGAHLLLLYRNPVTQIAEAVAAEMDPADAVTQWQQEVDELLAAYRLARRRITLLEISDTLAEPNTAIQALNQHLGLSLRNLADTGQAEQEPEHDPVHMLIADRALHQDSRARHIAAELEVSALPLTGNTGLAAIDLSATCQSYREIFARPQEQDNKLLELEKRNEQLADENQKLKAQAQSEQQTGSAQEELKEENELLLMQLHQVQEELESYFLENQDITKKLKAAEKENEDLERQARQAKNMLQDVHASLSWKITAPLRLLLRPFKGK